MDHALQIICTTWALLQLSQWLPFHNSWNFQLLSVSLSTASADWSQHVNDTDKVSGCTTYR